MTREERINIVQDYRNHMAIYESEYDEYAMLNRRTSALQRELQSKWRSIMNFIFAVVGLFGLFLLTLNFAQHNYPSLIKELDAAILARCMLFRNFDSFLIIFSIINLVIVHTREKARRKAIMKEIKPLYKREKELLDRCKAHYQKYKNPPLTFAFSAPGVIDCIIEILENNELTIEGAVETYEKMN